MQKELKFVASLNGKLEFDDEHERSWMKKLHCEMWCNECLLHSLQLLTRVVGGKLMGEFRTEQPSALVKADQKRVAQFLVVNTQIDGRL